MNAEKKEIVWLGSLFVTAGNSPTQNVITSITEDLSDDFSSYGEESGDIDDDTIFVA